VNFETWFPSQHPSIPLPGANAVLRLKAEGGTVPFIARYRKEQTGNLDEVKIQNVMDAHEEWEAILKRQAFILGEIEHQQKLTPELKEKITTTFQLNLLEDLYLPYKKKRKTKATLAKEAGLEPLAEWIWKTGHGEEKPLTGQTLEIWAFTFRNEAKAINDAAAAIQGAQDILVERLSENQELRQLVRSNALEKGSIKTGKGSKVKPNSKYEKYFDYLEPVSSLLKPQNSHRYMAIRRGWIEEELSQEITGGVDDPEFENRLTGAFEAAALTVPDAPGAEVLKKAAHLALKAHVMPSISSEIHKALKQIADEAAIRVFADNVRKLMLASPFGPKAVLGVDPGIRTGCKLAVIDASGKYVGSTVIQLQSEEGKTAAKQLLPEIVKQAGIQAVAVGNGTAGRETELFVRDTLKEKELGTVPVVMVSESGASVYSASEVAREEFPELDVTVRGAISIARRLQDPLAELVKIDPKSIGVGQYQHDVTPTSLKKSLDFVVDSCVNSVGVNLNTASYHLLAHVSGIGEALAKAIVTHRGEKGIFKSRQDLMEVERFSTKAFEQAAGFLRIPEATNPLDNTGVHPERYPLLEEVAKKHSLSTQDLLGAGAKKLKEEKALAETVGHFTFNDMIRELEKPGRDPREAFVPFHYRDDIRELKDLTNGMVCPGIVTNVTNFGAFVDIGVHQDGLVHLSQLSDRFVRDPKEIVSPGDRVQVRVIEVNLDKSQIALSMKTDPEVMRQQREAQAKANAEARARHRPAQQPQQNAHRRQEHRMPPRPQRPQFKHNPFAALAALKNNNSNEKKK